MRQAAGHRTAALEAAQLLCATADFLPLGTHLLAHAVDLDAQPAHLELSMRHSAGRHDDRPAQAARTAGILRSRLASARRPGDPAVLLATCERLTAGDGYARGLFAVALTEALGPRTGRPEVWRARLRALRRHAHPDVREAAMGVRTASE